MSRPPVVIAHDYLTQRGGAERVVLALLRAFPGAPLVTSVYAPDSTFPEFASYDVRTTWLNRLPGMRRDPRVALPLLAPTWSRVHVDADVVICSTSGWSHGVRSSGRKLVYCHNPPRWLHQSHDYVTGAFPRLALAAMRPSLLRWDLRAAASADRYLVNSTTVAERVRQIYGVTSGVLHPPVAVDVGGPREAVPGIAPGFLLTVNRPRSYKNVDLVCEAVRSLPGLRLVVVGELPPRAGGWGDRVHAVSGVSDAALRWLYASCSALVAVAHEDFGLTPIECSAFGRPVVALRRGGYLDTVVEGGNGTFVEEASVRELRDGITRLLQNPPDEGAVRQQAERFNESTFAERLRSEVAAL